MAVDRYGKRFFNDSIQIRRFARSDNRRSEIYPFEKSAFGDLPIRKIDVRRFDLSEKVLSEIWAFRERTFGDSAIRKINNQCSERSKLKFFEF